MLRDKKGRLMKKGKDIRAFFLRITKKEKELIEKHRKQEFEDN